MGIVFAPGCALMIYKPELAGRILGFLNKELGPVSEHLTCCRHAPDLPAGTQIINVCAGCDRRYRTLYEGISTISLWEVLCKSGSFPFPNYSGEEMTVLDACPARDQARIHDALRYLLAKMNIRVTEPSKTRTGGACCGDSLYGQLPPEQVKQSMRKRADEMPAENVVVYCVSCVKAMHIGGKKPRHMADLLFGDNTAAGICEPDEWHAELDKFIDSH
ncbi:MAG: (Fe-S)-binding protein [Elusimicrobiales bacterium]